MKWSIAGVILCACATAAYASDWLLVGTSSSKSKYYFDGDSIRSASSYDGDYITAWIKVDSRLDKSASRLMNKRTRTYRHIAESKQFWHLRCDQREMRIVSLAEYDLNGNVINSVSLSYPGGFEPVIPDSIGEEILIRVCKYSGLSE